MHTLCVHDHCTQAKCARQKTFVHDKCMLQLYTGQTYMTNDKIHMTAGLCLQAVDKCGVAADRLHAWYNIKARLHQNT